MFALVLGSDCARELPVKFLGGSTGIDAVVMLKKDKLSG